MAVLKGKNVPQKIESLLESESFASLNESLEAILGKNDQSYSFIASVHKRLRMFKLDGYCDPAEIVHEAYERAIKIIEQGTEICNPKAWLRATCFNIIHEKSREQQKQCPTDPQSAVFETVTLDNGSVASGDQQSYLVGQRTALLMQALKILEQKDPLLARLLKLRLLEKLTWREIRVQLLVSGVSSSEEALRQKASRAKKDLREIYNKLQREIG